MLNKFFKRLYSSPSMIWKAGAGLVFFCLSLLLIFKPSFNLGLTGGSRLMLGALMMAYALFRFYGCYAEYKSYDDE